MDYIKAFVTGGLLCAAVQILMDKTKLMPGRIMVLLVVCGSILGAIGLYVCQMGGFRGNSAAAGVWEYALEGRAGWN